MTSKEKANNFINDLRALLEPEGWAISVTKSGAVPRIGQKGDIVSERYEVDVKFIIRDESKEIKLGSKNRKK